MLHAAEVKIIALITAFLIVHPLGSSLSGILQYLNEFKTDFMQKPEHINDILEKHSNIFAAVSVEPSKTEDKSSEQQAVQQDDVAKSNDVIEQLAQVEAAEKDKLLTMKWKFCGFLKSETFAS